MSEKRDIEELNQFAALQPVVDRQRLTVKVETGLKIPPMFDPLVRALLRQAITEIFKLDRECVVGNTSRLYEVVEDIYAEVKEDFDKVQTLVSLGNVGELTQTNEDEDTNDVEMALFGVGDSDEEELTDPSSLFDLVDELDSGEQAEEPFEERLKRVMESLQNVEPQAGQAMSSMIPESLRSLGKRPTSFEELLGEDEDEGFGDRSLAN
jgi:hypothetical protein